MLARKLPSPSIGNAKGGTRQAKTAPAIQEKNHLRHHLHDSSSLNPNEIAAIKTQLKLVNKCNHDLVEMAKAKWYDTREYAAKFMK